MTKGEHTGWYLVLAKPHQEAVAKLNLERQGFVTYLPLLQQQKLKRKMYQLVIEPLFPRYLFIRLSTGVDDWSKIRSTRGCISLVRFGGIPARVPYLLIQQLQENETKQFSNPLPRTPDFKPGEKIQIVDGLLMDYKGIVEIKNSGERITVLLEIAKDQTRRVNLSVHQVKSLHCSI